MDAASVRVIAPRDPSQRVAYLSTLENLEFKPADTSAKIIVNNIDFPLYYPKVNLFHTIIKVSI